MFRHLHWHFNLEGYKNISPIISIIGELGAQIFLFCSAFGLTTSFLSKKPSLAEYWKKRVIRIYPLYVISLIFYLFFVAKISFGNFLIHAVFLHNFFLKLSHNPEPLWFMGVLIQFYIIFPLSYKLLLRNKKLFGVLSILLYLMNAAIIYYINTRLSFSDRLESSVEDSSVFSFILIISFGMFLGEKIYYCPGSTKYIRNYLLGLVSLVTAFIMFYLFFRKIDFQTVYTFGKFFFPVYSSLFIMILIEFFAKITSVESKLIVLVSSSIFCSYLFHEFIFHFISLFSQKYIIGILVAIPLTLLLAIYIQKMYNFILLYINNKYDMAV